MVQYVGKESIARIIDAFVENLDLEAMEITKARAVKEGRGAYDPRSLLKLYLYGARKGIRSSRKLAEACLLNAFHEFNRKIEAGLDFGYASVDGSRIRANNSKDNNFTTHKLDDRVRWLAHIE